MRWVFSRRIPETGRILLVESGKREVSEKLIPHLKRNFGKDVAIDLLTCLPGEPEEVAHGTLSLVLPAAQYITGVALPVDGGLTVRNA